MASSFCWLSVLVKFRASKQRTIVKCSWQDSFCAFLEKLSMSEAVVCKIEICKNENFCYPVHVVPIDAPVILCEQFQCFHVCIYAEEESLFIFGCAFWTDECS